MDYSSALHSLLRLVDYERMVSPTNTRARYDLRRMEALLHRLGDPHLGIPTVHVAGTKGKGSTAAMCASVLSRQGYRTGLYTSPHLHTFRERVRLDGAPISEEEFAALVEEIWPDLEWVSRHEDFGEVTMFEALTAMALCYFRKTADLQVLEVGLGGRLDTTNLAIPEVSVITSLSLDHTSVLGDTIEAIASEKAGIIKPGVPVVTSPQVPEAMTVIESVCHEKSADLIKVGNDLTWSKKWGGPDGQAVHVRGRLGNYTIWTSLIGDYQLENVTTAMGALEVLKEKGFDVSDRAIREGFGAVDWPCRLEVLSKAPPVICDGAHNPHSAARLRDTLPAYFDYRQVVLVVGVSKDKNMAGIVQELAQFDYPKQQVRSPEDRASLKTTPDTQAVPEGRQVGVRVVVTRSRHPRAVSTASLADAFLAHNIVASQVEGVDRALDSAIRAAKEGNPEGTDALVLVTGSLFVAAEAREAAKGIEPELYPELQRDYYPSFG